ncbi:hypothetical protein SK128_002371, partial [Halocaridina rubra]
NNTDSLQYTGGSPLEPSQSRLWVNPAWKGDWPYSNKAREHARLKCVYTRSR